jgi:hypothetical protein
MEAAQVTPEVRAAIRPQETRLAALEIPRQADAAARQSVESAVRESFIAGFRLVMALAAGLAFLSAGCAAIFLESAKPK